MPYSFDYEALVGTSYVAPDGTEYMLKKVIEVEQGWQYFAVPEDDREYPYWVDAYRVLAWKLVELYTQAVYWASTEDMYMLERILEAVKPPFEWGVTLDE